jgi:acyl-CoA thioesterase
MYARLHDQAADAIDTELLTVLLADVPPTPVLGHFTTRARASSVTWALEPHPVVAADGWWRADTEALAVAGGLVNQHTRLWAPDGTLAAFATQLVAVYG